ncbi:MAG: hypothetical protein R2873_10930 [Caldilineaceae bacterium]
MAEPLVNLLSLLGIALVGLLVWASLAPFEALGWWAGWFGDKIYQPEIEVPPLVRPSPAEVDNYIVFLSGISRVSGSRSAAANRTSCAIWRRPCRAPW